MGDSGSETRSKNFRNGDFYTGGWKNGLVSCSRAFSWEGGVLEGIGCLFGMCEVVMERVFVCRGIGWGDVEVEKRVV